jgi:glutaconate CoA-transferase subunit B
MMEGRMGKQYAKDFTTKELIAAFLARDFEDGEILQVGANQPIARAAVLLAHLTHGPNIKVGISYSRTNLLNVDVLEPFELSTDFRAAKWAEYYYRDFETMVHLKSRLNSRFFIGALQIDPYGNSNLIGIGNDFKRLKLRGPGGIGAPTISGFTKCYYLLVNSHNRRIFVEKCDFISAIGFGDGSPDYRGKMGLAGGGPRYCVTPLSIMDFDEKTRRMRLKSIHPGITVNQVVENTGFELILPKEIPVTEPPTEEEIEIFRTRVDVEGLLRK